MGFVPPWPKAKTWVQNPRKRYAERGLVPTLLVLWSMKQNAIMPIHGWLQHLAKKHAASGLEIISVCEDADPKDLASHLKSFPFPGSVALDTFVASTGGAGETMNQFAAGVRGYPWVLLLDIDQKVVWEGNPGFHPQFPWKPGEVVHVDGPLDDLVKRQNLPALRPWMKAWASGARDAVLRGDLATSAKHLDVAKTLPGHHVPAVADAQAMRNAILRALEGLAGVKAELQQQKMEPALPVLLAWADLLKHEVDADMRKALEKLFKKGNVRRWGQVLRLSELTQKRIAKGTDARESLTALRGKLARDTSPMVVRLRGTIDAALAGTDDAALSTALASAPSLPARWLASEYLQLR
jgi:hypothetical protein